MVQNCKFGPAAQTPAQRSRVLAQMQELIPQLKVNVTPYAQQLYAEYVAGELEWMDLRYALDAAPILV